jgi:hypothetical protein
MSPFRGSAAPPWRAWRQAAPIVAPASRAEVATVRAAQRCLPPGSHRSPEQLARGATSGAGPGLDLATSGHSG